MNKEFLEKKLKLILINKTVKFGKIYSSNKGTHNCFSVIILSYKVCCYCIKS